MKPLECCISMPQNQKVVSGSYDLLELYHHSIPLYVLNMYAKN